MRVLARYSVRRLFKRKHLETRFMLLVFENDAFKTFFDTSVFLSEKGAVKACFLRKCCLKKTPFFFLNDLSLGETTR